ncbi:MAG: DEAD/DEAH box helicase, partial [Actinobacteria bacterium]|nr:DEAD/DEAH box helicase [Actinomycetota bacterium]
CAEIAADLAATHPMNRLLQGDVGSGKTAVALYAMLAAVANGLQAALVAPTELLAEQHHASITRFLAGSDVRVELVTGSLGAAARREALARLASGEAHVAVGTHALLMEGARFGRLGLAVIDEQHRFGVEQRAAMRAKAAGTSGEVPHVLVMTATPIPRTLSLTVFGDLDVSVIRSRPAGRQPVTTRVVGRGKESEVYAYLRTRIDAGEQCYVVVPAVEESASGLKDAEGTAAALAGRSTARCRATAAKRRWTRSGAANWTCWWRRSSSRWASTFPTPRSWWSSTRTGSGWRSCTSCGAASAAARGGACACWSATRSPKTPRGAWRRSAARTTGSRSPSSTLRSAAPASCSEAGRAAFRRSASPTSSTTWNCCGSRAVMPRSGSTAIPGLRGPSTRDIHAPRWGAATVWGGTYPVCQWY